jgi:PmbA protein
VVGRARQNALASPADPNFPGLASPTEYTPVQSFDEATAACSPERRAREVGVVCRLAAEKQLNASGAFSTAAGELAVCNSLGVFAYHRFTRADFQTTMMAEDASGRAQASAWQASAIAPEELGGEAIAKTERGRNPRKIEPGEYAVVFDPYATQDLVDMLDTGATAVLEGRSWMNERLDKQVMSPLVSIWDDGLDTDGLPSPFDYEGMPKRRVDIVRSGVICGPVYNRYTAHKAGTTSTGHALAPAFRMFSPQAANLFMAPGETSLEEMIRSTPRGLYITRFWYTRLVHPRDCVVTGMTRDGVFMIENGELAYPVKNLRFTQSYVQALADVEAVGREVRLIFAEYGGLSHHVPSVKIGRFNFTGSTV